PIDRVVVENHRGAVGGGLEVTFHAVTFGQAQLEGPGSVLDDAFLGIMEPTVSDRFHKSGKIQRHVIPPGAAHLIIMASARFAMPLRETKLSVTPARPSVRGLKCL